MFFNTIVTVLVALCALLIFSAIILIKFSVDVVVFSYVGPELSVSNMNQNQKEKEKKKRGTEGCTTPNPTLRTSATHLKKIHSIFPAFYWGKRLVITLMRKMELKRTCPGCRGEINIYDW